MPKLGTRKLLEKSIHLDFKIHFKTILGVICLLALLIRLPGIMYGLAPGDPDFKFLDYNGGEFVFEEMTPQFMGGKTQEQDFYPKGLSFEMAVVSNLLKTVVHDFGSHKVILVGRALSVMYGTLTIAVLFLLILRITVNLRLALLSSIFLIFSWRLIFTSAWSVADAGVLFWICMVMYTSILCLKEKSRKYLIFMIISAGMALSFKFAVIVFIPVTYILIKEKYGWQKVLMTLFLIFIVFYLANGGKYTLHNFHNTLYNVSTDNISIREYNKLINPLCYLIILVNELTLPIFAFGIAGMMQCTRGHFRIRGASTKDLLFIIVLPLVIYLLTAFSLDYAAPRHVLFFYPFWIMMASFALLNIYEHIASHRVRWIFSGVILFLLLSHVFSAISLHYSMLFDARKIAAKWIDDNLPSGASIFLSEGTNMPSVYRSSFKIATKIYASEYVVIHRDNYLRFIRSLDNPLTEYPRYEQVFHPDPEGFYICQGIFKGDLPYVLIKEFTRRPKTLEMGFFNKILGPLDGYGDVLIYKKIGELPADVLEKIENEKVAIEQRGIKWRF